MVSLSAAVFSALVQPYLPWYLAAVNLLSFLLYGADKHRAEKGRWRIREKTLFVFPLLGGSFGAFDGMYLFRHKTRHWYFRFGIPLLLLLQAALLFCLLL